MLEKNLKNLLEKQFLTWNELDEVMEHEKVEKTESLGYSGMHYPKKWYVVYTTDGEEYSVYIDQFYLYPATLNLNKVAGIRVKTFTLIINCFCPAIIGEKKEDFK